MEGTRCSLPSGVVVPKEQAAMVGTETWCGVVVGCGQLRFGGEFFLRKGEIHGSEGSFFFLNFVARGRSRSEVCGVAPGTTMDPR